nr:MAG: RNA dependent RNA polymerase [Mitoviridae sp. gcode 1]
MANYVARVPGLAYFVGALRSLLWGGSDLFPPCTGATGRLGFKQEPAGKVRVFAMVDPWSQWLLRPLHKAIFGMLQQVPFDATFDQLGKVTWFTNQVTTRKIKKIYSYDLTAATDRLPILLQVTILSVFLPLSVAQAWGRFLTERWYVLPKPVWNPRAMRLWSLVVKPGTPFCRFRYPGAERRANEVQAVRYAVGQPMGALSSWAMLALTHHCIVWMAAIRGRVPTSDVLYLVLGDDIVIANSTVARCYLEILSELGCPVNLTKSIVSHNGSFEFAKRFIFGGLDVSPISWAEMSIALIDIRVLLGLVQKLPYLRISAILNFMGHGYKAVSKVSARYSRISRSMGRLLLYLSIPGSSRSKMTSFTRWLMSARFNVFEGHVFHKDVRGWILQLLMKLLRTIKYPGLPLSEYAVRSLLLDYFGDPKAKANLQLIESGSILTMGALDFLTQNLWKFFYGPLCEEMKYSSAESRGRFMKGMMTAKTVPFSSGPIYYDSMDTVFNLFWEMEEALSTQSGTNESLFNDITDVVTLNRCRELNWADQLRSQFPRLNIGFSASLRKGSTKAK